MEPCYSQRPNARRQRDCLNGTLQRSMECISRIEAIVGDMDAFCRTKKNVPDNLERVSQS